MSRKTLPNLHICVGIPPILRIDGELIPLNYEKFNSIQTQRMMYDILSDEQIQRFEDTWELDFSYSLQGLARFRVNIFKDKNTVAAAFRLIPMKIPTITDLQLPAVLETITRRPRGLVLVTGPTGSGKSTTLAAMVNQINTEESKHIITIEDPIEYLHQHRSSVINQREVGQDTKEFKNALRAALREDPDVILVGEMRDLETMQNAIRAAETGHLVFATLHTNSAAQTVDRVVDQFPVDQQEQIRLMLSNSLEAVLCQQLLPEGGDAGPRLLPGGHDCYGRYPEPDPRSEEPPACVDYPDQRAVRHDDHGPVSARLLLEGTITYDDAIARAMNAEDLKSMIAQSSQGAQGAQGAQGVPNGMTRR